MARFPLSVSKFRYTFFGWWLIWSAAHAVLVRSFGFDWRPAIIDSLISNITLMAACWLVSNIFQYYLPQKDRQWNMLFITVGLSLLVFAFTRWALKVSAGDQGDYLFFLSRSLPIRFCLIFLMIGCMTIISALWYNLEEEQENRKRKTEAEKLARDAELFKLRQQLQPHFLFNSLNSISALAGTKPEEARKMIQQLSDFLRGTLRKEDQVSVTLGEELQYLELYLEIEKVRFGYRLSTSIESSPELNSMKLPPMLLQPIVENAIKFGLYDTTEPITIRIVANKVGQDLELVISNPFDPETSSPKKGTGFGLNSVKRRLYLLFARNDLLQTRAENNIFYTTVRIPQV